MKAQELRVGNLISFKGKWNGEVEEIKSGSISIKDNEGIFPYDVFEPILLTDEWFIKWGFFKDGEYWSRSVVDYNYCFKYRDWAKNWAFYQEYTDSSDTKDDGVKYVISFDIEFVHQLQNLWYTLLHKEIEENEG